MEAFNIYMEITKSGGDKLTFVNKTWSCTGWEVLNPFQAHFQEELLIKKQKI